MFPRPLRPPTTSPLSWISRSRLVDMPLRAKITNPAFQAQAASTMSDMYPDFKEQPGDDPDDVLFNTLYGVRTIQLNRPKKYNALNGSMIRKIIPRLKEYQKSALASIIIIGGAGPKAFCAGGDVSQLAKDIAENGETGQATSKSYFGLEYKLDHLIATYPKPYIAYLDGITMGGGVGLSVHAPIRIATENTNFAMPETGIGFFPDVGGSFFLPRLEGFLGTYLALTSESLKGVQALYAGVATHYIDSSVLSNLTARLAELVFKDYDNLHTRLRIIDRTIEEFNTGLPHNEPPHLAGNLRLAIDYCFHYDTVEQIVSALEKERDSPKAPSQIKEWATKTLEKLGEKSPTSLKVTLRQMRLGARWNTAETFNREYHIAAKFMRHPDFVNGVSARLIHKPATKARWEPDTLEGVSNDDVENFFKIDEGEDSLDLLTQGLDYDRYPFEQDLGLPREEHVEEVVKAKALGRKRIISTMVEAKEGKIGVSEKVEEILGRRAGIDGEGKVVWKS
ncbi:3-hydroxyisobutyryl-CoA hydrolase [Xanthoria calcicola]